MLKGVMDRAEKEAIRHALAVSKGNKAHAAKLLGIHRTLLYKKIRKHGIPLYGAIAKCVAILIQPPKQAPKAARLLRSARNDRSRVAPL